jgi:hypothetical protein
LKSRGSPDLIFSVGRLPVGGCSYRRATAMYRRATAALPPRYRRASARYRRASALYRRASAALPPRQGRITPRQGLRAAATVPRPIGEWTGRGAAAAAAHPCRAAQPVCGPFLSMSMRPTGDPRQTHAGRAGACAGGLRNASGESRTWSGRARRALPAARRRAHGRLQAKVSTINKTQQSPRDLTAMPHA